MEAIAELRRGCAAARADTDFGPDEREVAYAYHGPDPDPAFLALLGAAAGHDVGGAFDMGVLGMNGAIDPVTKSEEARARGQAFRSQPRDANAESAVKVRANCARRGELRAKYGADPRLATLDRLCKRLGY